MKNKSLGINACLNMIRTALSVVFPLITFPYISSVLSIENVGKYNFAYSVITYFELFAGLGISTYAIREGAKLRNNYKTISKFASEIFTINLISTIISYTVLILCIIFVPRFHGYESVLMVLSIYIITITLGCEWIYSIYEEYLYITVRAIVAYALSLVLLFIMVKEADDLLNYAFVMAIATGGSNLLYIISRRKYCRIRILWNLKNSKIKNHMKPILMIFGNTVTTNIYVNAGMILLGFLSTEYHVGLYSVSVKIYSVVKKILAAVITVSIPRLSNLWGTGKYDDFSKTANKIFVLLISLVLPAVIGLMGLSEEVINIISNKKYLSAKLSLIILCFALIFSDFNWFFTSCILIPVHKEEKVLHITIISACINVGVNSVFIPLYQQNAAAIATLLAEGIGMILSILYARKYFKIQISKKDFTSVIIGCCAIIGVCIFVKRPEYNVYLNTGISIILSILAYGGIMCLFKNSIIISVFNFFKKHNRR